MKIPNLFMVFDVESVGLHGEGYAVGWCFVSPAGGYIEEGSEACHPKFASGAHDGHNWAITNALPIAASHGSPRSVRDAFWKSWVRWKEQGAVLAADCAWPVEARFLLDCIRDDPHTREWSGPYPLIDIGSVLLAKGMDPLKTYDRLPNELPIHNPLNDARQSARMLRTALLL